MAIEHVSVAVREDFVARQTRAKPIPALSELIWNALDGDASSVNIEFEHHDLAKGLSKIVIYDDGEGLLLQRWSRLWRARSRGLAKP